MPLLIRKAQHTDLPKIVELYGSIGDSPLDPFASVQKLRKLDSNHLLIAEEDGQFAGFLYYFIHRRPWFDAGIDAFATIIELHVQQDFMNRGIGTSLLQEALAHIRNAGITVVYVDTGEDNAVALHIYRKAGFRDFKKQIKLKLEKNTRGIVGTEG